MNQADILRIPPQSIEAEQSLLGALLLENTAWERVADLVSSRDFYKGEHRVIYEHIELVLAANQPADMTTVGQSMTAAQVLDRAGGYAYLAALAQSTPSALNVRRYAEIVREKAVQRNLIRICSETIEQALSPGAPAVEAMIEAAERRFFELRYRRTQKRPESFPQLIASVVEDIDRRYNAGAGEITGLRTGYGKMDAMTAGLQRGDLVIVAGRPSMGKTSLAMNIAEFVGIEERKPVAVFSLEMADKQLVQRMLGSVGKIDQHKLRTGRLNDADWQAITGAAARLNGSPFIIEETSALSIIELRARARRIARDNPELALIIVDYLQLMASGAETQSERTAEIGNISRGMKALAKELDIPVIALSQLNRGVEQRPNKRPLMSDLRDSGSIEQDADLILFIYRDEVYQAESAEQGHAEIIVGKQRNGAIGHFYLRFVKEETRFENCEWTPPRRERKKKTGFVAQAEAEVAAGAHDPA